MFGTVDGDASRRHGVPNAVDDERRPRLASPGPLEAGRRQRCRIRQADFSLKSLLTAVRRTRLYDGEILGHWARLNNFGIHGGLPWDRESTALVLDTVAGMDAPDRFAQFVARAADLHEPWHEEQLMDDEPMRLRAQTELVAPLVWRGPPAALSWLSHCRFETPPRFLFGLQFLAHHMGLRYDPDALFREYKRRGKSGAGRWMELRFDWQEAAGAPPARYEAETGKIHLGGRAIEEAADRVGTPPRALGSVLGMVQAVRGLLHVATDLDGQLWRGAPRGEAPRVHALVAAVVDRVLDTLADPGLRAAFEVADPLNPPGHGAWRALR